MDRQSLYKKKGRPMKEKTKYQVAECRKLSRLKLLSSKRIRYDLQTQTQLVYLTEEEVKEALNTLSQKKTDNRCKVLQTLRATITQTPSYIDIITKKSNGLPTLVGLLSGNDPELQLEAAWCLTNMTANTDQQAAAVLKHAGSYLVTYLNSNSDQLQDQCAWILGNIAASGHNCRKTIMSQGAIAPLIALLQSDIPSVTVSAAFALVNMIRDDDNCLCKTVECGILPVLKKATAFKTASLENNREAIIELLWLVWYLTNNEEVCDKMASEGFARNCAIIQEKFADKESLAENIQLVTPAIRSLGNLTNSLTPSTVHLLYSDNVADNTDNLVKIQERRTSLMECLHRCLCCDIGYLQKETLWTLSNILSVDAEFSITASNTILPSVIEVMSDNGDMFQEGIHCLYNMALSNKDVCQEIMKEGNIQAILTSVTVMSCDPDVIILVLSLMKLIFDSSNCNIDVFKEAEGVSFLRKLTTHNDSSVQQCTQEILEMYFDTSHSQMDL